MMARTFVAEDIGLTVDKYFSLKGHGLSDERICKDALYISATALRNWKLKNGIIGQKVRMCYKPRVANNKRIEINNRMKREGKGVHQISDALQLQANSYRAWRSMMQRKGFEVL